jgi:hypothetical protein
MNSHPPLPKDPRAQRFADLRLRGASLIDAYQQAGYKSTRTSSSNAKKLEKRPDVQAYLDAIRHANATEARIDRAALIRYCEDILLTPLNEVDDSHPLCQEFRESESGERVVKMPGKLLAAKQLAELHGWNKPQEVKVEAGDKLADIIRRVRMR